MLFALGFLFLFTIGGFTGPDARDRAGRHPAPGHLLRRRALPLRAGGRARCSRIFAGVYYWLPKWTGHMYDETLGKLHFWLSLIFFNVAVLPACTSSAWPACRAASPTTRTQFADWNMVSSIGAFGFGLSQLLFVYAIVKCIRGGAPAPAQPWEGARRRSSGRCRRRRRTTPSRRRRLTSTATRRSWRRRAARRRATSQTAADSARRHG